MGMDPLNWSDDNKRANQVIANANKIGAKPFLTAKDIVDGNDKLNMAFVAQLFNTCPGLKEVNQEEQKELAGLLDDDEGDTREERAFRMWMNSLGLKKTYVNNLYEDARSGLVLLKVIDKIEPGSVKWRKKVERKRNNKLILGFTWQLMRYHLLKFLASLSADGKAITDKDVVDFCNNCVANSDLDKKPQIKGFSDESIGSGIFFIYLVASIEPEIVNWELVTDGESDEDKKLNAKYAISLARKMGAIIFLLPEDIVEVRNKMCMTFCAAVMAESYKRSGKLKH